MIVFYLKNVFQMLEQNVVIEWKEMSEGDIDQVKVDQVNRKRMTPSWNARTRL